MTTPTPDPIIQDVADEQTALSEGSLKNVGVKDGAVPALDPASIQAIIAAAKGGGISPEALAAMDPATRGLVSAILSAGDSGGTKKVDPDVSRGIAAYVQIWGQNPPKGYMEQLVKSGMNVQEIIAHELSKTDQNGRILAKNTHYWRDRQASYAAALSQLMGRR